jgi:hypothetical protein
LKLEKSTTLRFCDTVAGISCCDADEDAELRQDFEARSISNAACATIVKHILCEVYI